MIPHAVTLWGLTTQMFLVPSEGMPALAKPIRNALLSPQTVQSAAYHKKAFIPSSICLAGAACYFLLPGASGLTPFPNMLLFVLPLLLQQLYLLPTNLSDLEFLTVICNQRCQSKSLPIVICNQRCQSTYSPIVICNQRCQSKSLPVGLPMARHQFMALTQRHGV